MEKIITTMKKVVSGLDFATVAKALDGGMANVGSYIQEDVDAFLRENGLAGVPRVFMANHSIGGRDWEIAEGRDPAFYEEECFNGGWYVLTNEDCTYLYCDSATSGSSLTAVKQDDGTWTVTLEVPVGDDGQSYQGFYWGCFHNALGLEPSEEITATA